MSFRAAAIWSLIYVAIALLFGAGLGLRTKPVLGAPPGLVELVG
jgi:hypothetical protein